MDQAVGDLVRGQASTKPRSRRPAATSSDCSSARPGPSAWMPARA